MSPNSATHCSSRRIISETKRVLVSMVSGNGMVDDAGPHFVFKDVRLVEAKAPKNPLHGFGLAKLGGAGNGRKVGIGLVREGKVAATLAAFIKADGHGFVEGFPSIGPQSPPASPFNH
jgi:hypothetical protein